MKSRQKLTSGRTIAPGARVRLRCDLRPDDLGVIPVRADDLIEWRWHDPEGIEHPN